MQTQLSIRYIRLPSVLGVRSSQELYGLFTELEYLITYLESLSAHLPRLSFTLILYFQFLMDLNKRSYVRMVPRCVSRDSGMIYMSINTVPFLQSQKHPTASGLLQVGPIRLSDSRNSETLGLWKFLMEWIRSSKSGWIAAESNKPSVSQRQSSIECNKPTVSCHPDCAARHIAVQSQLSVD